MQKRRIRAIVYLWLAAALSTIDVRADVGPPVEVRLVRELTGPAVPGEEYNGAFEVLVGASGTLDSIVLDGDGWVGLEVDAAQRILGRAGDVLRFDFTGTPGVAAGRVRLTFNFNDFPVVRSFDLSPERFARMGKAGTLASLDDTGRVVPFQAKMSGSRNTADVQQIRFHGRLVYQRPTSASDPSLMLSGADNLHFLIKDADPPPSDDTIYSGFTDPYGYFDVTVNWEDCDITGCDIPDIYIIFKDDDDIVTVWLSLDPLTPGFYLWSTEGATINDFTGSEIDFGTMTFPDTSQNPALQIHNSIVRAHRYIQAHDGTDVTHVDVLWPETEGGSGAYYVNEFQVIHLSPSRQWNEDTHTHEYGHHFLHNYSVNVPPDYANGICDTDKPGHCMWCPETDHDAWNEGWPNWLADIVTRSYPIDYHDDNGHPYLAYSTRDQENIQRLCSCCITSYPCCFLDQQPNDPFKTEGYVGALLRDIDDFTQDDHDNRDYDGDHFADDYDGDGVPDCFSDKLGLGWEPIFQIVKLDKPTTIVQFINAFRNRYPQYEQDFYATVMNVSKQYASVFPEPQPIVLSQTQGCQTYLAPDPIVLNVQGNGSQLQYQWRKNFANLVDDFRISGADSSTLTISPSAPSDGGIYDCVVTTCDDTLSTNSVPFRVSVFAARGTGTNGGSWGGDGYGQLGRGSLTALPDGMFPASMADVFNDAVKIAEGEDSYHKLAIMADGTVWAWGDNSRLQLGRTGIDSSPTPMPVPGLADVVDVKCGQQFSVALTAEGRVFVWGDNVVGERGDGHPTQAPLAVPYEVPIDCAVSIAAGRFHVAAVTSDGHVWTWGTTGQQLGYSQAFNLEGVPTQVPGITDAAAVAAGDDQTMVLRSNGTVLAFGSNGSGQLGDGTFTGRSTPMPVLELSNVRSIHCGENHNLAILQDGTVYGWGSNSFGELGLGNTQYQLTPVPLLDVGAVLDVAAGIRHTVFLRTDHTVWTCGNNGNGQVGRAPLGGTFRQSGPVGVGAVIGISAGWVSTYVLTRGMAPQIVSQPGAAQRDNSHNIQVVSGQSISLPVHAIGSPTLRYAWLLNDQLVPGDVSITGADTPTLTIYPVQASLSGPYSVYVENEFGAVTSESTILQVRCARGDVDCNGKLNQTDAKHLFVCLSGQGTPNRPVNCPAADFTGFDMDHDGDVDLKDIALFFRCFSGPAGAMAPECAVP